MVWKVFASRFMAAVLELLAVDVAFFLRCGCRCRTDIDDVSMTMIRVLILFFIFYFKKNNDNWIKSFERFFFFLLL